MNDDISSWLRKHVGRSVAPSCLINILLASIKGEVTPQVICCDSKSEMLCWMLYSSISSGYDWMRRRNGNV